MSAHLDLDDVAAQSPLALRELQSLRNLGNECETAANEIERLRAENERLRDWIAEEGKRTDTCTKNVLMRVCEDCRCGKLKTPNAKHEPGP